MAKKAAAEEAVPATRAEVAQQLDAAHAELADANTAVLAVHAKIDGLIKALNALPEERPTE